MQHFKVQYSKRGGPGFIHFTGQGRIIIFDQKKIDQAEFYTQPKQVSP